MALFHRFSDAWSKRILKSKYSDKAESTFNNLSVLFTLKIVIVQFYAIPLILLVLSVSDQNGPVTLLGHILHNNFKDFVFLLLV